MANEADHETNTVSEEQAGDHRANKLFECAQYEYTSPATPLIGIHFRPVDRDRFENHRLPGRPLGLYDPRIGLRTVHQPCFKKSIVSLEHCSG